MTGKEITDAALDYAYAAGKLAAKLEAYNRDVEEFLAKYGKQETSTVGEGTQPPLAVERADRVLRSQI